MLYFVPAWYKQNSWGEDEQYWYTRRMRTEFDETVKQVQLFHRSGARPYRIMLLSFAPNFRHFLHRQSVYHAPYWSCFDAIQEVTRTNARLLSYKSLGWPEGVEFVYTAFALVGYLNGEKYAQVDFGEDGNPIQVDVFKDNELVRRNLYDDRGFLSSAIQYKDGEPVRQDYMMEDGTWKLKHYLADDHVEINPEHPGYIINYEGEEERCTFSRIRYRSLTELIEEVVTSYVNFTNDNDVFCVATHDKNVAIMRANMKGKHYLMSFFDTRYSLENGLDISDLLSDAAYIVTDSQNQTRRIMERYPGLEGKIRDITPYDSRVDLGISSQLSVQKILVPIDGLEEEVFKQVITQIASYLPSNENARVHIFTRKASYGIKDQIMNKVKAILLENGYPVEWALSEEQKREQKQMPDNVIDMALLDEEEEEEIIPTLFFVEQCVAELDVSKCMREQRVIVDMRKEPALFIQITAISTGIPQIVATETQYLRHGQNGHVVESAEQIPERLEYYLGSLNNWNKGVIGCYEMGKNFTTKILLFAWKEVIQTVEQN